jgi:HSP90 family molecular chaperone
VDAPAAILSPKYGYSAFSDRVLRSQTFGEYETMRGKSRTLAINPHHPLLQKLRDMAIVRLHLYDLVNSVYSI